jgi:hypothetical protein
MVDIDQPGGKLKRTFAAAVAAVMASTSMWLTATMAASVAMARPAALAATLRVVPRWTYQDGGSKGRSLLIKVTGKTRPGKYEIVLLCEDKHNQPDSVDMKTVRIYKVLGVFQQPDQPALPAAFKPDVTVSSGPPAAAHLRPRQKGH